MAGLGIPYVDEPSIGHMDDWARHPHQAGLNPAYRLDHPMTLDGTVDGFYDMTISGSSVNYFVTPPADEVYWIARLNIVMVDADFNRADRYGSTAALATGIAMHVEDNIGTIIHDFTPIRIKTHTEWGILAGNDTHTAGGAGADPLIVRWTFERSGAYLVLDGRQDHRLVMEIPDNLGAGGAALDEHIVLAQGVRLKTPGATV